MSCCTSLPRRRFLDNPSNSAGTYSRVVDANLILAAVTPTLERAEDIDVGLPQHGGKDDVVEFYEVASREAVEPV